MGHPADGGPTPEGIAKATIDDSIQETVCKVDFASNGMEMTNHKRVTESELGPAA